jgi:hypothetical protein
MALRPICCLPLLLAALASRAAAQTPAAATCPVAPAPADSAGRRPDVTVIASAHADQLRFESAPRVQVRVLGCGASSAIRVTERRNLPKPVQPGVTYRDVSVGVEIRSYLNVQCLPGAPAALAAICAAPAAADTTRRAPPTAPER